MANITVYGLAWLLLNFQVDQPDRTEHLGIQDVPIFRVSGRTQSWDLLFPRWDVAQWWRYQRQRNSSALKPHLSHQAGATLSCPWVFGDPSLSSRLLGGG